MSYNFDLLGNVPNLSSELDNDEALSVTPRANTNDEYYDSNVMIDISSTSGININLDQGGKIMPLNTKLYNPTQQIYVRYIAPQQIDFQAVDRYGVSVAATMQYYGVALPEWFNDSNIYNRSLGNPIAANLLYSWGAHTERRMYTALYTPQSCTFVYTVRDVWVKQGGITIVYGQVDPSLSPASLNETSSYEEFIDDDF